ncbi:hypothetical protein PHMEG_00036992 [Phytophthora megakarya]|uniref:MULE transposase domain-containing protein n=1 Tax=Phytophthora megakarya TaxID=4795 RepID=A0A225UKA4_9STRA|nr:hypothetical protein PHMEG_00036992 [Phytophthora megakarya]
MIYDPSSELYLPVIFTLTTAMTKLSYLKLLRCVEDCVGCKLTPKEIVCTFEGALIGVIREVFPQLCIIGSCGRKLKMYRIPKADVKVAMAPGVFDILSVFHTDKIDIQGIACEDEDYSRWRKFWNYFRSIWMDLFPPEVWNVFGKRHNIVSRTHNPLERFHRHLNAETTTPHPAMHRFINNIETLSREYLVQRKAILSGLARPPQRTDFQLPREPVLPSLVNVVESESETEDEDAGSNSADRSDSYSSELSSEQDVQVQHEHDLCFEYEGDETTNT